MNSINMIGYITKKPEISELTSTQKCTFTIAVKRKFKNKDDEYTTDFFVVDSFGEQAKRIYGSFDKGSRIAIEGSLHRDQWKDENDNWKSRTYINLKAFTYIEKKDYEPNQNKEVKKEQPDAPTIVDPFANNGIVNKEPFSVEPTIEVVPDELPF
jgi:single-strand DNA-binding protein